MKTKLPVRVMLRVEGDFWNAYFGEKPAGAILIASLRISIAEHPESKQAFIDLLSQAAGRLIKEHLGAAPTMEVSPAPESERGGRA